MNRNIIMFMTTSVKIVSGFIIFIVVLFITVGFFMEKVSIITDSLEDTFDYRVIDYSNITSASLNGLQIFPKDHIWNVPVNTLPVDSRSAVYIDGIGTSSYLGLYRGIPYNVVDNTVIPQNVTLLFPAAKGFNPVPIPANPLIEGPGGIDHHLLIVNRDNGKLYEFYKAVYNADGSLTANSGFSFNLSGYELVPKGTCTTDAAGDSVLAGLVRYDEVSAGEINHALRVAIPASNNSYVWPARSPGNFGNTNGTYPPMGQRFRLKASFNTTGYPPQTKTILEALKKYGMTVADMNGGTGVFQLTFAPDSRWDTSDLGTMFQVHGSDFEAVDVSSLMINENSGQARTTPTSTPTAQFTANIM